MPRLKQNISGHPLLRKDRQYVWHPFTQMKDYARLDPILITKAKGLKLYDHEKNYYYDTISSWWCNLLGHNIPQINQAVTAQLKKFEHVLFAGFTNEPAVRLAEQLVMLSHPNLQKVFFSDNGSTAVEVSLKLSYQYWQNMGLKKKSSFICLENGYHGDTIGAMSVSGVSGFNSVFKKLFFPSFSIPSPYCYRCSFKKKDSRGCSYDCLSPLKKILKQNHSRICGIILEPLVQAAGGMIIYPAGYLDELYNIVSTYDIHIILDEIAVGFGRTETMFAYQHSVIIPDLLCLSKGITNGTLPMGVTLTSQRIYDAFYADYHQNKTFFHGHTFTGNPLSAAAALKTLELIGKQRLIAGVKEKGDHLYNSLNEQYKDFKYFGDIRHQGLICALEIVQDKRTKEIFPPEKRIGWRFYLAGLKHNLLLRPLGHILYFFLPLSVEKQDINTILEKFHCTVKEIFGFQK